MPISKLIVSLLKSDVYAGSILSNEEFQKEFTSQHRNELIEIADKGNQRAQYYIGMCILYL